MEYKMFIPTESETLEAGGWSGAGPTEQEDCGRGGCRTARHVLPGHRAEWWQIQPEILHCQVRKWFHSRVIVNMLLDIISLSLLYLRYKVIYKLTCCKYDRMRTFIC